MLWPCRGWRLTRVGVNRYECFFDAFGDVRTISLPNYDAWPLINKHGKCLQHSLDILNELIVGLIREHEARLDAEDKLAAANAPRVSYSTPPPPAEGAVVSPPDMPPPPLVSAVTRASRSSVDSTLPLPDGSVVQPDDDTSNGGYGKTNLLHRMVDSIRRAKKAGEKEPLTHEELRANLVMFFIAGHDTTSTAMSWSVHYLANYPAVQEKLRQEVLSLGPWTRGETAHNGGLLSEDGSDAPAYEQLSPANMPYLDAFIKEVMRLRPPVGNVWTRMAAADTQVGKYIIKKGSLVSPSPYNVHHDPSIWPNPDEFRPER